MTDDTKQEGIMRIGRLLDESITLTGKNVGGNGRFTQGSYDPGAEEREAIAKWLEAQWRPGTWVDYQDLADCVRQGVHHTERNT
jgi:hypothetical protein